MNRLALILAIGVSLLAISPARAQSTQPLSHEDQALRVSSSDSKPQTAHAGSDSSSATASTSADLSRIVIALVVVIGLILLLKSGIRQISALPGTARDPKLVRVLSRSVVAPRQQVLVLQVGNRLLVVGDSSGRMNALCEITDPDEIAMMIGQTRQASESVAQRIPGSFVNFFRRASEPFSETDALASTTDDRQTQVNPDEAVSSEEMTGLMDKVRMLQEQFRAKV